MPKSRKNISLSSTKYQNEGENTTTVILFHPKTEVTQTKTNQTL